MAHKRGNPNWGKAAKIRPSVPTEFEVEVKRLGLARKDYASSDELRNWCEQNRHRCYIPEWLLEQWGFEVDVNAA